MERRDAQTIRFPGGLLEKAREVKEKGESINEFVVEAVEKEVRRRQGLQAIERIIRRREKIRSEKGLQPDSVPLIRALREGEGRYD